MDYTVADRDPSGGRNLGRAMDWQGGCEKPHGGLLQGGLPIMGCGEQAAFCWHPGRSRLSAEMLNKLTQLIPARIPPLQPRNHKGSGRFPNMLTYAGSESPGPRRWQPLLQAWRNEGRQNRGRPRGMDTESSVAGHVEGRGTSHVQRQRLSASRGQKTTQERKPPERQGTGTQESESAGEEGAEEGAWARDGLRERASPPPCGNVGLRCLRGPTMPKDKKGRAGGR